jgi:hypothetical protein
LVRDAPESGRLELPPPAPVSEDKGKTRP